MDIFMLLKHVPIITKLCSAKLISASSKELSISSVQIEHLVHSEVENSAQLLQIFLEIVHRYPSPKLS